jgi:creatinine amidohydrolase
MQNVRSDAPPKGKLSGLGGGETAFSWYADYPEHYAGDARPATAQKGEKLLELLAKALATFTKAVKDDQVTEKLAEEFWARERGIRER